MTHGEQITCKKDGYADIQVRRVNNLWFDRYEWADRFHQYYGWNWKPVPMPNDLVEKNIAIYGVPNARRD